MAKPRTAYVCAECGAESPKWQGQCPDCNAWNSYSEVRLAVAKPAARASYAGKAAGARAVTPRNGTLADVPVLRMGRSTMV